MRNLRILAMFYVDVNANKGDSIRARETIHYLSESCQLHLVAMNTKAISGPIQSFSVPAARRGMAFVWNLLSSLYGIAACIVWNPKLIYADACPGSIAPAFVSMITGKTLVVEMHTPAGAQDVILYRAKSRFRVAMASLIESIMLRRARLVVASKGWADLVMHKQDLREDKLLIMPLAVNHDIFYPMDKAESRRRLSLSQSSPIAIFVGNVGPWQGLETLIEAAPQVLKEFSQAVFLIVGDGASRLDLVRRANEVGVLHAFHFVGSVPYEDVATYISAADVGLALFPANRGTRSGVSAHKTLNYLACGRPVVISEMDEMAATVAECHAGRVILPGNPPELAEAISWVFSEYQRENGAQLVAQATLIGSTLPTWRERIERIVDQIAKIN